MNTTAYEKHYEDLQDMLASLEEDLREAYLQLEITGQQAYRDGYQEGYRSGVVDGSMDNLLIEDYHD